MDAVLERSKPVDVNKLHPANAFAPIIREDDVLSINGPIRLLELLKTLAPILVTVAKDVMVTKLVELSAPKFVIEVKPVACEKSIL